MIEKSVIRESRLGYARCLMAVTSAFRKRLRLKGSLGCIDIPPSPPEGEGEQKSRISVIDVYM